MTYASGSQRAPVPVMQPSQVDTAWAGDAERAEPDRPVHGEGGGGDGGRHGTALRPTDVQPGRPRPRPAAAAAGRAAAPAVVPGGRGGAAGAAAAADGCCHADLPVPAPAQQGTKPR